MSQKESKTDESYPVLMIAFGTRTPEDSTTKAMIRTISIKNGKKFERVC